MMSTTDDLTRWLDGAGVSWRVVHHEAARSAAAEAIALARPGEMVAKTVVLHDGDRLVSVVIPASERISPEKLAAVLGNDVTLAHEDEIARAMPGYELGALPPCGPGVPPLAIIDQRLLTYGHVLCAAGDVEMSLALDPEELVRLTGAAVVDVCG